MAGRDIFGFTDTKWGGTFWDRNALFEVGSGHISLIQDYSIQYAQNIQPLYEVGSDIVYFSKSHQAGTLSINRVLSDDDVIAFWGDGCEVKDATIQTANGICGGSGSTGDATATQSTITLTSTILQSVTWSGRAQQAYVSEGLQVQFVGLQRS